MLGLVVHTSGRAMLMVPGRPGLRCLRHRLQPQVLTSRPDQVSPCDDVVDVVYPICAEPVSHSSLASNSTTALAFLALRPVLKLRLQLPAATPAPSRQLPLQRVHLMPCGQQLRQARRS